MQELARVSCQVTLVQVALCILLQHNILTVWAKKSLKFAPTQVSPVMGDATLGRIAYNAPTEPDPALLADT